MKLIKGYSLINPTFNPNLYILMKSDGCGCGESTGLITETETEEQAIDIFNKHIPILGDSILDDYVLIKKIK